MYEMTPTAAGRDMLSCMRALRVRVMYKGALCCEERMRRLTSGVVLVLFVTSVCMCLVFLSLCMSHYMAYGKFLRTLNDYDLSL